MSDDKATPRPWAVGRWMWARGREVPSITAGGATVAQCHVAPITPGGEAAANAALIVCAVNRSDAVGGLIATAREILSRAEQTSHDWPHIVLAGSGRDADPETRTILTTLRAALAALDAKEGA